MSTFAYSAITARREAATPTTSADANAVDPSNPAAGKPGIGKWVDAATALVPAEVLAVHAFMITQVTETKPDPKGKPVVTFTSIGDAQTLFWALLGLSVVVYVFAHRTSWGGLDLVRMLIPPGAFVLWCALQNGTAFDAVADWSEFTREMVGVFGVIVLGGIATALAYKADAE